MRFLKTIWEFYFYRLRWHQTEVFFHEQASSPLPPEAVQVLERATGALESTSTSYALSWGTALGLYRNGGFIPHDNDIDIDLVDISDPLGIIEAMQKAGIRLAKRISYRGRVQQLVFVGPFDVTVDLNLWTSHGDLLFSFAEPGYTQKLQKRFIQYKQLVWFAEHQYPLPGPTEEYLAVLYGADWRTPKKRKGDWKEDCHILHKRFDPGLWFIQKIYPWYRRKFKLSS